MTSRRDQLLALYAARTGRTTTHAPAVPADTLQEQTKRMQYWPDRSQHYAGW